MKRLGDFCKRLNELYASNPRLREAQRSWERSMLACTRARAMKERHKQAFREQYEDPGGKDPWTVFWQFVFHDARATGDFSNDLKCCLDHGILRKRS